MLALNADGLLSECSVLVQGVRIGGEDGYRGCKRRESKALKCLLLDAKCCPFRIYSFSTVSILTRHQEENHGMKGEARTWCVHGVALSPVEVWESLWPQLPLTSGRLTFLHSYLL